MKKLIQIVFIVLSISFSGMFQFAFHLCSESGFHWSDNECDIEHHTIKKSCCKTDFTTVEDKNKDANCCSEAYFLAFAPQYGKIKIQDVDYHFGLVQLIRLTEQFLISEPVFQDNNRDHSPPENEQITGRTILLETRKLLI